MGTVEIKSRSLRAYLEVFLRKSLRVIQRKILSEQVWKQIPPHPSLCRSRADGLQLGQQWGFTWSLQVPHSWFWAPGPDYCQPARLGNFWKLNWTSPCPEIAIGPSVSMRLFSTSGHKVLLYWEYWMWKHFCLKGCGEYCCPFSFEWAYECVPDNN